MKRRRTLLAPGNGNDRGSGGAVVDLMSLHPVELICPSCASYVHRFLDGCPGCGWRRASAYALMVPGEPARVGPLPRTRAELSGWLAAHGADRESIAAALSEAQGIDDREPGAASVIGALAAWVVDPDAKAQYLAAVGRFYEHKEGRTHLSEMARKLTFRYPGGLPDAPDPADANLTYTDGALVARARAVARLRRSPPSASCSHAIGPNARAPHPGSGSVSGTSCISPTTRSWAVR